MKNKNGFSLVELAIVLVIIGLITGGILTGQDLIKSSELNRTYAEVNKLKTAMNTFRLKYNMQPGDLSNASSYWAAANNGNGNGRVDNWSNESTYVWDHLQRAGLSQIIASSPTYNGIAPISGDFFIVYYSDLYGCQTINENVITLHGGYNTTTVSINTAAWTTDDALSIDGKYDDGLATTGKIRGCNGENSTGATVVQTCISGSAYTNLGVGTERCKLLFY